jgi:hypothetical protein
MAGPPRKEGTTSRCHWATVSRSCLEHVAKSHEREPDSAFCLKPTSQPFFGETQLSIRLIGDH